ncbi:MAG TPA: DNA repair protein RecO [Geobacteraceae bacterium]
METCRCEAILLGATDYREADRIVTLFTLEQGKLKGVARGAKRSLRRFGGALEPFALLTVQLALTGGLARIDGADAATIHPRIRADLLKIGYAGYACEAVDLLLPEGLPNPRLFRLLAAYLERLDAAPPAPSDRRFFETNLLNILGYRPVLEECASCGAELSDAQGGCRAGREGEVLCSRCGRGGRPVSMRTIGLLRQSLRTGRFGAVEFTAAGLSEAGNILDPAIASHVSRPMKSLAFLREMGDEVS